MVASWGKVLQDVVYTLNQHPIYDAVSPIAGIYGSSYQGLGMGVPPLTIMLSNWLVKILLPVPAYIEILVLKEATLLPGDNDFIQPEVDVATWPLWLFLTLRQQKGFLLAVMIGPDRPGETGLLLHNGDKRSVYGMQQILGDHLVLSRPWLLKPVENYNHPIQSEVLMS